MDHKCSRNMRKYQYSTRMKLHGAFKTQLNRKLCANTQRNISEILSFIHNRLMDGCDMMKRDSELTLICFDQYRCIWEPLSIYSHIHTAINRSSLFLSCFSFSLALASGLFPFFVFFPLYISLFLSISISRYLSVSVCLYLSMSLSLAISLYLFSHFFFYQSNSMRLHSLHVNCPTLPRHSFPSKHPRNS